MLDRGRPGLQRRAGILVPRLLGRVDARLDGLELFLALGVALIHEMRMGVDGDAVSQRSGELMCNFGYGLPDCRVWRYWDDRVPLKTTGAAVKTLTLARQGKTLVVVGSLGPGGETVRDLDRRLLGVPDDCIARDAETGAELPRLAAGRFQVNVARHDFRLVRIETRGP